MKPSQNTLESLSDMDQVRTAGDFRRIAGQALLALVRKEMTHDDASAAAKLVSSAADMLNAEVKTAITALNIRDRGGDIGKTVHLGNLIIGTPEKELKIDSPFKVQV